VVVPSDSTVPMYSLFLLYSFLSFGSFISVTSFGSDGTEANGTRALNEDDILYD